MFKKVLIAEDMDAINTIVRQILHELDINHIEHASYCDDAILKVKKAIADNDPFDLFISDLSFETDYREVKVKTGDEAIEKIRMLQPNLKIIVYSVEDNSFRIKPLFDKQHINAFIHKGRKSIGQLKTAIQQLAISDTTYISPEKEHLIKSSVTRAIDELDILIIKQLCLGISMEEMEPQLKALGISPNSKSTIEKRVGRLKEHFRANNTIHLIAIAKDLGIA